MKSYCSKCRKDTENINPKVSKTRNNRTMVLSKCAICGSKKWRFTKNQEAKGLLNNLGIKTTLSNVPVLSDILFWMQFHWACTYEIVNKFLLAGNKFMPEMHFKQPGFTYSVCGPFTKNKERI